MAATHRATSGGTFGSTLGTTGITTTLPTGATDGDILYLWLAFSVAPGQVGTVVVSGWTVRSTNTISGSTMCAALFRRVMQPGDTAPAVTWAANNSSGAWVMLAAQGANTASPEDAMTETGQATASTTHAAASVSPTKPDDLLLCFAAGDNPGAGILGSYTPPSGMTEPTNGDQGGVNAAFAAVAYEALSSGSATGTRNFTASNSVAYATAVIAVSSASTQVNPSVVGRTATVPAATVSIAASVTPSSKAATTEVGATIEAGSGASVSASHQAPVLMPSIAARVDVDPAPAAAACPASVPTPTIVAEQAFIPASHAATAEVVAPVVRAAGNTSAVGTSRIATVPTAPVRVDMPITAAASTAVATSPTPIVVTGGNPRPSHAAMATVPTPVINTDFTITAGTDRVATVWTPTVQPPIPATLAALAAVPTPTVSTGSSGAVGGTSRITIAPTPTVRAGATTAPAAKQAVAAFPAVSIVQGTGASVSVGRNAVALAPTPTVLTQAHPRPGKALVATVPTPTVVARFGSPPGRDLRIRARIDPPGSE